VHVAYGCGSVLLQAGWRNPQKTGQFWRFSSPLTMHCDTLAAKGFTRSPIMSSSRRDHAITAMFTANGIGWVTGVHSAGEAWSMIALFGTGQRALTFCSWESSRSSGIALPCTADSVVYNHLQAQRPTQRRWEPAYATVAVWGLRPAPLLNTIYTKVGITVPSL